MFKRIIDVMLGAVGIAGGGVLGLVYLGIRIATAVGGVLFLWWLSYVFYDLEWWPLGAITRIAAWVLTIGLVLGFLRVFSFVFMILMAFWSLVTAPFRSPRPLVVILAAISVLALAGGLIAATVHIISPDSTPDQNTAKMDAYFEKLEPVAATFVQDRDRYNTIARRVDGEARSESSPVRLAMLYTEWVQAARTWQARVESQTKSLKQVEPPPNLGQYHQLQVEVFELTAQFLAEIQRAYNVSLTEAERNVAYERAGTLNRQVVETQDRMLAELVRLGLTPRG